MYDAYVWDSYTLLLYMYTVTISVCVPVSLARGSAVAVIKAPPVITCYKGHAIRVVSSAHLFSAQYQSLEVAKPFECGHFICLQDSHVQGCGYNIVKDGCVNLTQRLNSHHCTIAQTSLLLTGIVFLQSYKNQLCRYVAILNILYIHAVLD